MELKDVLIEYRRKNGLSQRDLASKCGLSNSLISILENGMNKQTGKKPTPGLDTYQMLAKGMGMSMQELFEILEGSDEKVNLGRKIPIRPIVIPDTEKFMKILLYMTPEDYEIVIAAFERTYKRMKEQGEID